jgi:hypothetical protein
VFTYVSAKAAFEKLEALGLGKMRTIATGKRKSKRSMQQLHRAASDFAVGGRHPIVFEKVPPSDPAVNDKLLAKVGLTVGEYRRSCGVPPVDVVEKKEQVNNGCKLFTFNHCDVHAGAGGGAGHQSGGAGLHDCR